MSENQVPAVASVNAVEKFGDDAFSIVSTPSSFLPRVQVMGGNSDLVIHGKIGVGRYALIRGKEQFDDLNISFDCLVLAWRPKAMQITDDAVITCFDHTDQMFKDIMAESEKKDSGCMYGPEYLVWIPSMKVFALFFMGSKTGRREAPALRALLGKAATLRTKLIESKQFSWHGPVVSACSTPFDIPSQEEIAQEVEKFLNPPKDDVEPVEKVAGDETRAR